MATDSAFWRDLESRFRELLNIPEAARLTGTYFDGQWTVDDGPGDQKDRARLQQLFAPLARAGAVRAGTPDGADALDVWLNLLRSDTPYFRAVDSYHSGWIQNLVSASAEYCVVRATLAFESETAAAGVPALPYPSGKDAGPAVSTAVNALTDRRAEVDAFLLKCKQETTTAVNAIRAHIWRAAGYRSARQFEFWQASNPKATAQNDQNFRRILSMNPADFESLLKKKKII